jgi:hypothetical protein
MIKKVQGSRFRVQMLNEDKGAKGIRKLECGKNGQNEFIRRKDGTRRNVKG